MTDQGTISLRGVEVHNLKSVDLDLPRRKLIVFCGVSGSGKSSLAFDTLYAEGQRRYIESFSTYTRQFLERLEKPAAERIEGLPPAVAVAHVEPSRSSRTTIGTVTETNDYLRLVFAKIGQIFCPNCGHEIRRESSQSVAELLQSLAEGTRFLIAYPHQWRSDTPGQRLVDSIREAGFVRVILEGKTYRLDDPASAADLAAHDAASAEPFVLGGESASTSSPQSKWLDVVVDRLSAHGTSKERLRDSLETAFARGEGACVIYVAGPADAATWGERVQLDDQSWHRRALSNRLRCDHCGFEHPEPEPRLYSFNSPLGACPVCEGFGSVIDIDFDLIVPDPRKSLREGAIAPWTTPAYAHELEELLALADDYGLPVDVPFSALTEAQLAIVRDGVPERNFGGLRGFFAWLEKRKYKLHLRVFLSRWRSYRTCPECGGSRLAPVALATRVGGKNIAEIASLKIRDAIAFLEQLDLPAWERQVARAMLDQVLARLKYLDAAGLGYLALDRTLRTLSGGEAQRVALTSTLGSSLVNMLYVLDEPSIGLHPRDTHRLVAAIERLRDRGNTVVVVEHEEDVIRAADQLVEIGPGAGERGGKVVFQGTPAEMLVAPNCLTGAYLSGSRPLWSPAKRRPTSHGWVRVVGARGHNLKDVSAQFPLGVLCVVTGVSGAGKSTLVADTLYPGLARRKRKEAPRPLDHDEVLGEGQIDDVTLVDQSPIGRSPRSNPVTYVKAFDEIRNVFAETVDARTRNYTASYFSFNSEAGRCGVCEGDGFLTIDMQFMADMYVKCSQCKGTRYRSEILDVLYRGRNIAEVLELTVREAFTFFRGHKKVQVKLKRLMDVGLDYVRLGQPVNTLSSGEAQRLKLAAYLAAAKRHRTLFILDEPTTGLHFSDIVQLIDCFDALLAAGHSLIVIEHNLQLIQAADYIVDLGPEAADEGGEVVAVGTPEEVAQNPNSATGRYLAPILAKAAQERTA